MDTCYNIVYNSRLYNINQIDTSYILLYCPRYSPRTCILYCVIYPRYTPPKLCDIPSYMLLYCVIYPRYPPPVLCDISRISTSYIAIIYVNIPFLGRGCSCCPETTLCTEHKTSHSAPPPDSGTADGDCSWCVQYTSCVYGGTPYSGHPEMRMPR